jgi:hypothetical protein
LTGEGEFHAEWLRVHLATPNWRRVILAQGSCAPQQAIHLLTARRTAPCSLSRMARADQRFWQPGQKNVER